MWNSNRTLLRVCCSKHGRRNQGNEEKQSNETWVVTVGAVVGLNDREAEEEREVTVSFSSLVWNLPHNQFHHSVPGWLGRLQWHCLIVTTKSKWSTARTKFNDQSQRPGQTGDFTNILPSLQLHERLQLPLRSHYMCIKQEILTIFTRLTFLGWICHILHITTEHTMQH